MNFDELKFVYNKAVHVVDGHLKFVSDELRKKYADAFIEHYDKGTILQKVKALRGGYAYAEKVGTNEVLEYENKLLEMLLKDANALPERVKRSVSNSIAREKAVQRQL